MNAPLNSDDFSLFSGVVFDLDGTLIDTLPDILAALNRVMSEEGLRQIDYEEGRTFVGGGAHNLIEKAFAAIGANADDPRIDPAFDRFIRYYEEKPAIRSTFFPGIEDCLAAFSDAGVKMGICTNKPIGLTRQIIGEMKIADYFGEAVLGGDSLPVRKPDAAHLKEVIRLMDVPLDKTVMIGDSETDVGAARNAGLPVIAVDFGYTALAPEKIGADVLISSFFDLPAALRQVAAYS